MSRTPEGFALQFTAPQRPGTWAPVSEKGATDPGGSLYLRELLIEGNTRRAACIAGLQRAIDSGQVRFARDKPKTDSGLWLP